MELNDLILLAAASIYADLPDNDEIARKYSVKHARLLWKEVLKNEEED
jgi:hypothetical protein